MPLFSMTCVFAMLVLWRALCASVYLLASNPSRDKTSIGYETSNNPCCVCVKRLAGSIFGVGSVVTSEVTTHKRNRSGTRYNLSWITLQQAIFVGLMLVNCSYALGSNIEIDSVKSVHFASSQFYSFVNAPNAVMHNATIAESSNMMGFPLLSWESTQQAITMVGLFKLIQIRGSGDQCFVSAWCMPLLGMLVFQVSWLQMLQYALFVPVLWFLWTVIEVAVPPTVPQEEMFQEMLELPLLCLRRR